MPPPIRFRAFFALLTVLTTNAALAEEGKWTPEQILQLDPAWLKQQGLRLPPDRLWNPARGEGLLSGVISTGGCSAAFISPTGLFLTNHHCLFAIVQEHSTPARDLIAHGFLARNPGEELRSKTARVAIPSRFKDVSAEVLAAMPPAADDLARYRAIETKQTQIVAECEKQPGHRCRVASFDGGVQYQLIDTVEIADVRLVYAPPRPVGEFGGEIDNFAWPRHTGDFAIGRAYVNGQPFRPPFHFPLSAKGVKPGDFVMVMGYPGMTYRAMTAAEMAERKRLFEKRVDFYGELIRTIEETTAGQPQGQLAVAAHLKSLNNSFKNAQGQLLGLKRGRILEKQRESEEKVIAWAERQSSHQDAVAARDGLARMVGEQAKTWERDYLIATLPQGSKALYLATTIARVALERQKPDAERDPNYMDRELPRLRDRLEREQKNYYAPADRAMFAVFVRRALDPAARIGAVEKTFGSAGDVRRAIADLYAGSRVMDPAQRARMFDQTPAQLKARNDPLIELGFALAAEQMALRDRQDRASGTVSRLRPVWRKAVAAHAGKPVAPDANASLRVSFAHVKGYEPRDAVIYSPQTTMSGMLEKYTGEEPFDAPEDVLRAARARDFGPWADPRLNDLPLDFLSDADTSGGNSGSPAVNGDGEIVGVNFDRVWENVANDFGYNPAVARNVNADIRYLLWLLDRVHRGSWLLEELGIGK